MTTAKTSVMQRETHASRTDVTIICEHVEDWRRENRWSRETVADLIVKAHEQIGGPTRTGIVFDPQTQDTFERMRVNADRIFRWLDNTTKDNNLLPLNFQRSVLAAMPMDRRMRLVNELLAPVDLSSRELTGEEDDHDGKAEPHAVALHFQAVVTDGSAAHLALSAMLDGIDKGEPEQAQVKLTRAVGTLKRALSWVGRRIKKGGTSK
jgi:hypothetical protein